MSVKPDYWIRNMCKTHGMIEPFEDKQVREGVISYGVSSYGYDIRVSDEFKIFTNVNTAMVDPKNMDPNSMVDYKGEVAIVPPNSFALGRSVEYFRIPRNVITVTLGKCLTGDTRVVDARSGAWRRLDEFVENGSARTLSLDDWKLRPKAVSDHFDHGIKPVYLLKTRCGLEIKATAKHPFRSLEGWTPLNRLIPGDRIAVARSCPVFGTQDWPAHEATLLGLMLSDGQCNTPGSSPVFTNSDPRVADALIKAATAFGCQATRRDATSYRLVNQRGRGGIVTKNRATLWLESLGCNVASKDKHVPQVVFTARRESVQAFLRALFSGDGSVYGSEKTSVLEYYTISKELAEGVRHLLLRFGVFSVLRSKRVWTGYLAYRLTITDRSMIQRFAEEIGFLPRTAKQKALDLALASIKRRGRKHTNFDSLPQEAWGLMRDIVHSHGKSLNALGVRATQPSQSLGYDLASHVATATADPELEALVASDVVWDRVESIAPAGRARVYDLTVPDTHCFVANDLVVHNSTYARCGIITNVTPFEPEWEGFVTLEISNTTPLPAKIYANEGIAQVLFFESDEVCEVSYKDKAGKYQAQRGITLPKI